LVETEKYASILRSISGIGLWGIDFVEVADNFVEITGITTYTYGRLLRQLSL